MNSQQIKKKSPLTSWTNVSKPARRLLSQEATYASNLPQVDQLAQLNVMLQLTHLLGYPFVSEAMDRGALRLHAWYFDIAHGLVSAFDPKENRFRVIDKEYGTQLLKEYE